ncbi:MAG: hypothetical protein Ta2G_17780 [Termitinemataceae bacterium]|nr:MAG: hypothetical protein Ta2G_17780 [Termitinemataceae bacterium]
MKTIISSINLAEIQFKQNRNVSMYFLSSYDGSPIGNISFIGIKKLEITSTFEYKDGNDFPLFFCDMIITKITPNFFSSKSNKDMYSIKLLGCLEMEISIICEDLEISDVFGHKFKHLSMQINEQHLSK